MSGRSFALVGRSVIGWATGAVRERYGKVVVRQGKMPESDADQEDHERGNSQAKGQHAKTVVLALEARLHLMWPLLLPPLAPQLRFVVRCQGAGRLAQLVDCLDVLDAGPRP
jgi:hypothetical protein